MKIIALTGATGLVGSRFIELLGNEFKFLPIPSQTMDIGNIAQVSNTLKDMQFDMFLHLAAYTNVDKAEIEKGIVYNLNVEGTKNVFNVVQEMNRPFIHFSTDFVFDGITPPFFESTHRHPVSEYGRTKGLAEEVVEKNSMIIRIAYPYRALHETRTDFVRAIRKRLESKQPLQGIVDSLFTPTFIDDIAEGFRYLLNNYSPEVFHLVGSSSLSPYEACFKIAETFNLDASLIGKTNYEAFFEGRAKRPQNCKIVSTKKLPITMKTFDEGLAEMKKQLVI